MDWLHDKTIENGKVCFAEHRHFGVTIKAWQDFTAFEYGSRWASWRLAEDKRKTMDGYSARPCRRK